jgi:hypothetical protein
MSRFNGITEYFASLFRPPVPCPLIEAYHWHCTSNKRKYRDPPSAMLIVMLIVRPDPEDRPNIKGIERDLAKEEVVTQRRDGPQVK